MNMMSRLCAWLRRDAAGVAMVTTLLVMVVITGLGALAVGVATNNIKSAGRDRVAEAAMGTSEGGVAQALAYLRTQGIGGLACSPSCTTNDWGNSASPHLVNLTNGGVFKVWIEKIQPFNPPGLPRRHLKDPPPGPLGPGPGLRNIEQTVTIKPM